MAAKPEPRLFLDSNVIISGLYSPSGAPGELLLMHVQEQIIVLISQLILEEVVKTIKYRIPAALPALQLFLTGTPPLLVKNAQISQVRRWIKFLSFEDAAILAGAINAKPDYFVSGDKHFLANKNLTESGLHIVTPANAIKLIRT